MSFFEWVVLAYIIVYFVVGLNATLIYVRNEIRKNNTTTTISFPSTYSVHRDGTGTITITPPRKAGQ